MKCYLCKICVVVLLCSAIALDAVSAKKKGNNKYEGDFEFVDEVSDLGRRRRFRKVKLQRHTLTVRPV